MNKKAIMCLMITAVLSLLICSCSDNEQNTSSTTSTTSTTEETSTTSTTTKTYPTDPLVLYNDAPATYEELPTITPEELKSKIDSGENMVIVDVNPQSMYNAGHVPGAIHIPWSYKGFLENPNLPKSVLLVFYCVCENEEDSGLMGLSAVTKYGYRNIVLLEGGTPAWEDAGYALVPTE